MAEGAEAEEAEEKVEAGVRGSPVSACLLRLPFTSARAHPVRSEMMTPDDAHTRHAAQCVMGIRLSGC